MSPLNQNSAEVETINFTDLISDLGHDARLAYRALGDCPTETINTALLSLAKALRDADQQSHILKENQKDLDAASKKGLSAALIDRLQLTKDRLEAMADGVEVIAALPDPTGRILWEDTRPNGLHIQRVSVAIGVLGMIYESRPNVTIDAACLCLKSHNAVILRGGSESAYSARALHALLQSVLMAHNIPKAAVSMVPVTDRAAVQAMLEASDSIDVLIPRGGKGLIERVQNNARMPVFSHLDGICHVYVHPSARPEIAKNVPLNAKMRRTGICGALETLLLDSALSDEMALSILTPLIEAGCSIAGDARVKSLHPDITLASDEDWSTEYLDSTLSCKYVDSVEDAAHHINTYGSHHTDSILAEEMQAVRYFQSHIDSGIVMHNTSTQFADGGEFGMGAEIGIATGKFHARGPVGLEQLCTYKYFVHGDGQTRP